MKRNSCAWLVAGFWFFILACRPVEAGVGFGLGVAVDLPFLSVRAFPEALVLPLGNARFYQGYWYRSWNNRWHRASTCNGPWTVMRPGEMPMAFVRHLPEYLYGHDEVHTGGRHHYGERPERRWGRGCVSEKRYDGRGARDERFGGREWFAGHEHR